VIIIGVRAVQGHAHGLERFFEYVNYGPAGKDGKARTADDLSDPFLELGLKPGDLSGGPAGGGGVLSAEDLAALRDVRRILRELSVNEVEQRDVRNDALAALVRVQLALGDWPAAEGPRWYLRQAQSNPRDTRNVAAWLDAGQLAAKAGACHLGGVHEYWRQAESLGLVGDPKRRDSDRLRREFDKQCSDLALPRNFLPRSLDRWSVTPARMDTSQIRLMK